MTVDFKDISHYPLELLCITLNSIAIIFFSIVFFLPQYFYLIAITTFIYSLIIFTFEPENITGLLLYFLDISFLYSCGFFDKNKMIKNLFSILFPFVLILPELRFGLQIFIKSFTQKTVITVAYYLSIFFIHEHIKETSSNTEKKLILDIGQIKNLTRRDAEWLSKILNGSSYKSIAFDLGMNIGTVKNRFKIIFRKLKVLNKKDFINKYSNYVIYYDGEIIP